MVTRTCRVCRTEKPIEDFYIYRRVCKVCFLARTHTLNHARYAEQVAKDREGYNATKRRQRHRRKAAKQGDGNEQAS